MSATVRELTQGSDWAATGSEDGSQEVVATAWPLTGHRKAPPERGFRSKRLKGFEPSTFCMASRRSSQLSYSRIGGHSSCGGGSGAVAWRAGTKMLFRQIIHEDLGCASYFVADREAGVAAVVDPQWDIEP